MTLDETIDAKQSEYSSAMADMEAINQRRLKIKDELASLSHMRAAASKLSPAEAAAIGLTVIDGKVVQTLPTT